MNDLTDWLKNALADRYAIERELGSGGMATVYLAEDLRHGRKVAIKVLRPELAATLGVERFLREIQIAAKLTHPHILPLYDSGEAGGFLFYVMPFVEGESLRDRLEREKQLSIEDALKITSEVADALGSAHRHDVIHRDIKPENILLEEGHAVVADFGVARAVSAAGGQSLTDTGMAVGTPAYMSPEQATAEEVDGRSDIYSLACVLFEMLGGDPPYTGSTPQAIIAKKLSEPTPHISVVRELVPPAIEAALQKGLAKTPADRYATPTEFVEAFTAQIRSDVRQPATVQRRVWHKTAFLGSAVVILLAGFAVLVVPGLRRGADLRAADISRVAVLPCANHIGDSSLAYIPAGVRDEMINGLGKIGGLEVRGRSSAIRYRDTDMSSTDIARELGVGGLIECSVYAVSDDSVRVSASLLDALTDTQLWSDSYQRAAGQVFLLGSDVAVGVAEAIRGQVTPAESARIGENRFANQEAHMLYQRGRFLTSRRTEESIRSGIEHLERAIELDSSFALAHTGLADALVYLGDVVGTRGDIRPVDYMPRVRELVLRALSIDSDLADGHKMLGLIRWYYDYDYVAGEREARLAIELDPNNAGAWDYYGMVLSALGRDEEAINAIRRAIELDPVAPWILSDLSWILIIARRYEECLRAALTAMALDPDMVTAIDNAANAHSLMGNHAESIRLHERSAELSENPWHLSGLADAHARAGNRQEALRLLDSLHAINERQYVTPRAFANAYIGLDSLNSAIEWLIRAAEFRAPGLNVHIRHPFRDAIRDHPRYPELLRLMRLEP